MTAVAVRRKTHTVTAAAVRMKRERRGDYCCRKEKDTVTVSSDLDISRRRGVWTVPIVVNKYSF